MKVLIIDDEFRIRDVIAITFDLMTNWEIHVAASGWEGVQKAQRYQPDLIVLDWMMPEMSGAETVKHLQSDPSTQPIPIILMTAMMSVTEQDEILRQGVTMILTKALDPLQLIQYCSHVVEQSRSKQQT